MLHTNQKLKQFIPNGEWEGFYIYSSKKGEHKMNCFFLFEDGKIKGYGSDDIGNFEWDGYYDEELNINMIKMYSRHTVNYKGYADENGIWGTWIILRLSKGGFHIWPKKNIKNKLRFERKQNFIADISAIINENIV